MIVSNLTRLAAWACVLLIVVLSLVPGDNRPHTGFPGGVKHFVAYAGTAVMFVMAYNRPFLTIVGLGALSMLMEFLQTQVAGRHAQVVDAAFSTAGASTGALLAALTIAAVTLSRHKGN